MTIDRINAHMGVCNGVVFTSMTEKLDQYTSRQHMADSPAAPKLTANMARYQLEGTLS